MRSNGGGLRKLYSLLAILLFVTFARADASSPPSPPTPTTRPNVLFIISDDLSTLALPAYGNTVVKTPNVDRLAARGARFERAYCQYPLCLPSRNSFLSGLRADSRFGSGDLLRKHVPDATFLPEHFRKNGYWTARVGKVFHTRTVFANMTTLDDPACWDQQELAGISIDPCGYGVLYASIPKALPAHPEIQPFVLDQELLNKAGVPAYDYWMERAILKSGTDTTDANIARRTVQLMDEHSAGKADKPFFIAAGFRRPHLLWVAPEECFKLYDPAKIELPKEPARDTSVPKEAYTRGTPNMSDEQRRKAVASYYACVTHVDNQLGVLLDAMDRNKLWDNTIVVFTSDHGWHLDNHQGLFGKVTLFQEAARVPLIIVAPGMGRGVSPRTVEMVDFYPTLAELAGLPAPAKVDGTSLVPLLKDPQAARERPAYSVLRRGKTWGKAVYTEEWRYTEWGDDGGKGAELYDLKADPHEFHNLAGDPDCREVREKLKALLGKGVHVKDADKEVITSE
jgi:iduronate 2-sulfatase